MQPLKTHRGLIATLDRANVDTDQIIAKQFLKSIARTGFGEHLFYDWGHRPDGTLNPEFSLNLPRFKAASILVARNNFGSGSSREHAVWAIQQYGFKAVMAPSYADIFKNNASKNALLTIELKESEIEEIFQKVDSTLGLEATIDIPSQRVTLHLPKEVSFPFNLDPAVKERLLRGLDDIGITLKYEEALRVFESKHNVQL